MGTRRGCEEPRLECQIRRDYAPESPGGREGDVVQIGQVPVPSQEGHAPVRPDPSFLPRPSQNRQRVEPRHKAQTAPSALSPPGGFATRIIRREVVAVIGLPPEISIGGMSIDHPPQREKYLRLSSSALDEPSSSLHPGPAPMRPGTCRPAL